MDGWSPSATSYRSDRKSRSRSSSTSSSSSINGSNRSRSSSHSRTRAQSRSRSGSRSPIRWVEKDENSVSDVTSAAGAASADSTATTATAAPTLAQTDAANAPPEAPVIELEPLNDSLNLSVANDDGNDTSDNSIQDWSPDNWKRKKYSQAKSWKKPKAQVSKKVPPTPKPKPGKGKKSNVPTGKKAQSQTPQPQAPQPQAPQPQAPQPQAKSI